MKSKKTTRKSKDIATKWRLFGLNSPLRMRTFAVAFIFGGIGVYMLSTSNAVTPSVNVNAATYNVLGQQHDGATAFGTWSKRKSKVSSKISALDPGIIGMQEVIYINPMTGAKSPQRHDVVSFMTKKSYTGYTGSAGNESPIFWKKGTFTVLAKKDAMIVPADATARGPSARYLSYVRLKKGIKYISVFNYHFNQFRDVKAQFPKLKTYFDLFKKTGDSIIFVGDFNGYDLQVRNQTGVWRVDNYSGVDHVMASHDTTSSGWNNTGRGNPAASDHALIGASLTLN